MDGGTPSLEVAMSLTLIRHIVHFEVHPVIKLTPSYGSLIFTRRVRQHSLGGRARQQQGQQIFLKQFIPVPAIAKYRSIPARHLVSTGGTFTRVVCQIKLVTSLINQKRTRITNLINKTSINFISSKLFSSAIKGK